MKAAGNETSIKITGLRSNLAYYTAVRAYNSAGAGPFSATVNATTKKPREYHPENWGQPKWAGSTWRRGKESTGIAGITM